MLKSIEIAGFKSFGKKSKLDFKTPISAIVGPNGSGKSNVAEAFRFALGEQSMKSLRGKRSEDLIFNGSGGGQRSNRASVRVVLDNRNKLFDIDYDDVVIERVVHRDGTHEYRINDSKVRRKDIAELLARANIGSTGHHIISQGEADRILNVSPKERRSMIEDALGLRVYHLKRKDSISKLSRTEQNIKEVESLRREIKPHLTFLKKQVEKGEKAQAFRDELITLYKEYFSYEEKYLETEQARLDGKIAVPRGELKNIENEVKELQKILDDTQDESEHHKELNRIGRELKDISHKRNILTRDLGRVEGEIEAQERLMKHTQLTQGKAISGQKVLKLITKIEEKIQNTTLSDATAVKTLLSFIKEEFADVKTELKTEAPAEEVDTSLLDEKRKAIEREIEALDMEKEELLKKQSDISHKAEEERSEFYRAERDLVKVMSREKELRATLADLEQKKALLRERGKQFEQDLMEAGMKYGREITMYVDVDPAGDEGDQQRRSKEIDRLLVKLEDFGIGSFNEVRTEHKEVEERDEFLSKELADLKSTKQSLEELIKEIDNTLDTRFKEGLERINGQFDSFFSLMFGGGNASLFLEKKKQTSEDEEDDVVEGVEIDVNLPKKKIRSLEMLSGGERALTSIALLFALSQINPPPFIILDETDAALDEANSKRYGDMINSLSEYSQLILITHNRETMSRAGLLYGVTMQHDGISRLLSIEFDEAVKVAK